MRRIASILGGILLLAGCPAPDGGGQEATRASGIVNGSRDPTTFSLTDGQKLAIGWLHPSGSPHDDFCTATLITARHVITASHCTAGNTAADIGFGVGLLNTRPVASFQAAELYEHPSLDVALLVLNRSATVAVPMIEPIAANRVALSNADVGRAVEASGYGMTRDPSRDGRWFATVYIEQVQSTELVVNGRGQQGICYGDSGGPVISTHTSSTGAPAVLSVESWGDNSCVDRDHMTRLDAVMAWLDPILAGQAPADPCNGVDFLGQCNGDVLEWCQRGVLRQRDCSTLGTTCGYLNGEVGYVCTCGSLDYLGRCNGQVAEYCDEGRFAQVNCGARGQQCGWVDSQIGWFCTTSPGCPPGLEGGRCNGDVLEYCESARMMTEDCAVNGQTCVEIGSGAECSGGMSMPDAGVPDSAPAPDAATPVDTDGGAIAPAPDAESRGQFKDEIRESEGGCGCNAAQPSSASVWGLVLVLALLLSRRARA